MIHLLTGTVPVGEASIRSRNYVELVITHPRPSWTNAALSVALRITRG